MLSPNGKKLVHRMVKPAAETGILNQADWQAFEALLTGNPETAGSGKLSALLTKKEVAELLKVCTRTIELEVNAGKLKPVHPTGKRAVRFFRADIERYMLGSSAQEAQVSE